MDIYKEIDDELHKEWKSGSTQQKIADRAGLTNPFINNLLSGKRKVCKLSLETFLKLFPDAKISLHGDTINGTATASGNGIAVGNDFSGAAKCKERIEAISNAILDSDMDDASKIKALRIIKEIK